MNNFQLILDSLPIFKLETFLLMMSMLFLAVTVFISVRMTQKLKHEYRQVKIIRDDLKAFSLTAIGVGKRVMQLERRQRELLKATAGHDGKVVTQVVTQVETVNQTYEEAAAMARQGNDVDTIMNRCALSHSEAELIFLMNRLDKAG